MPRVFARSRNISEAKLRLKIRSRIIFELCKTSDMTSQDLSRRLVYNKDLVERELDYLLRKGAISFWGKTTIHYNSNIDNYAEFMLSDYEEETPPKVEG